MLHSGCVKLHQKFRDFVGLPMGLLREESPKNRMNTGLLDQGQVSTASRLHVVLPSSASADFTVLRLLRLCFGRAVLFNRSFPADWGARLRISGG